MRRLMGWLLAALVAGAPAYLLAQAPTNYNFEVPPSSPSLFPGPLGHYRMEEGGFFMGLDGLWWGTSIPLLSQQVAVRGFMDFDGSITGTQRTFVGSGTEALNVNQIQGPYTLVPGFNLLAGWRFESGTVLTVSWIHLNNLRMSAEANLVPPDFQFGEGLADTFLFAPVYQFTAAFAGEAQNVNAGAPGATFGIWNAAQQMQIQYLQRFDQFDIAVRLPMWATEKYRTYGIIGPRLAWIWDEFKWRTISADVNGNAVANDVANYRNRISNRMYGIHCGGGHEWFIGDTPVGAFSISTDIETGLFLDIAQTRVAWELEDRSVEARRRRNFNKLSPLFSTKVNLWWYPLEAIQFTLGYDFLAYFNTTSSRRPIDFNFSSISPDFTHVMRYFSGISFGFGITF